MDLTTTDENGEPWDFSKSKMREKAIRFLNETKPARLILSPPCTMFSAVQNININEMKRRMPELRRLNPPVLAGEH